MKDASQKTDHVVEAVWTRKSGARIEEEHVVENNVHENGKAQMSYDQSPEKQKLKSWLNRFLKIKMTDGRILTGAFLCTDRDANIILGSCAEYLSEEHSDARVLGLVMVSGRHILSIHMDSMLTE